MERLKMAVTYGADAVYLAGTAFGMRAFAGNFSPEELPKAVEYCHSHGVQVHVTVNTMPRNEEAAALPAYLEQLQDAGVDALILADLEMDHPYNSYIKAGLIPGPISNPGTNSLLAALDPNDTKYYYYVYDHVAGEHLFSKSEKEHNKNVEYVRSLDD